MHHRRRITKHPIKSDVMDVLDFLIILNLFSFPYFKCRQPLRVSIVSLIFDLIQIDFTMSSLLPRIDQDALLQFFGLAVWITCRGHHAAIIRVLNSLSDNCEGFKRISKWRSLQCVTADWSVQAKPQIYFDFIDKFAFLGEFLKCRTGVSTCFLNQSVKVVTVWQTNSGLSALDRDSLCFWLLNCICLYRQRPRAAAESLLFNMRPNIVRLSTVTAVGEAGVCSSNWNRTQSLISVFRTRRIII